MIDIIYGTVVSIIDDAIILMVGGFGLRLFVPHHLQFKIQSHVTMYTYLHWNQEQGPTLFGFTTELDRQIFLLIISCSGIGPKIGLSILNTLGSNQCIQIIYQGDVTGLSKVPGIGTKKAEQIIVTLKHKVEKLIKSGIELEPTGNLKSLQELADVLTSLNYSKREIDMTMQWLNEQPSQEAVPFDKLMRQALSFLAKKA